ncbi:hypothetical protein [Qipengyuania qiaonensis]|uniref:Uncharacterized protein n=1 Tax=Qipengyuania qiaonensis TaxID=2867240 RepID=A0ABS7J2W1_9SPHN|nr:hypothetical protein [Qipengyuania qiaonensis]MBX7481675.1 hypothetical protein [Qipengyuania qiaonensis]
MSEAWHFDAYDARAGRGFVTYRRADLAQATALEGGTWFVGPPDFAPEYVASRAIAYSAARSYFGLGLLDGEGREVAFPSLAAAVDFVRRGYYRGSGGDGPPAGPGGAPPGAPGAPEAMPPFEPEGGGWAKPPERGLDGVEDPVRRLLMEIEEFDRSVASTARGEAREVAWSANDANDANAGLLLSERLALAGLRLAVEQVRSVAAAGSPAQRLRQANRLARLGRVIVRAGLAGPFTALARREPGLDSWLERSLWSQFSALNDELKDKTDLLLAYLLAGGSFAGLLDTYGFGMFQTEPLRSDLFFIEPVESDPIELLAMLALPEPAASALKLKPALVDVPSLFHLLYAAIGTPQALLAGRDVEGTLDLLLFAALCVTQPAIERSQPPLNFRDNAGMRRALAAYEAFNWLVRNMPQFAFSEEVEERLVSGASEFGAEPA